MADFSGTVAYVGHKDAFAGHAGFVAFKITLSAATYGGGDLNLSGIAPRFKGANLTPANVAPYLQFRAHSATANYLVNFIPAATPTWANLGTLKLFSATATEASGTLSFVVYATGFVNPVGLV